MKTAAGLIKSIRTTPNPAIISDEVAHFVIEALREKRMNLYEAYLLNQEIIRFRRLGYTQSGWNQSVRITICLQLLNQKLLAQVFNDSIMEQLLKVWAMEAYHLNKEKRTHYVMDRYIEFLEVDQHPAMLMELSDVRLRYDHLDEDDGPYHNEAFPYGFFSPEDILMNPAGTDQVSHNQTLSGEVEDLIVELSLI